MTAPDTMTIEQLDGDGALAAVPALAEILRDSVANGASVGFMDWNTSADFESFWRGIAAEVAAGRILLFVARDGSGVVGTAQLHLVGKPNQPHRAEIAKVLVHSRARRPHQRRAAAASARR
jgi:hypothetical protein